MSHIIYFTIICSLLREILSRYIYAMINLISINYQCSSYSLLMTFRRQIQYNSWSRLLTPAITWWTHALCYEDFCTMYFCIMVDFRLQKKTQLENSYHIFESYYNLSLCDIKVILKRESDELKRQKTSRCYLYYLMPKGWWDVRFFFW